MNIEQKADNEIHIDDEVTVCQNTDGLYVISSNTHTFTLNEHGCVVAVPNGHTIAINDHGSLADVPPR